VSGDEVRELREDVKEISGNVTRITTILDLHFHPETGTFTREMEKVKAKVEEHDTDIKRAKWTLGVLGMIGLGTVKGWLKQSGIIS
jgi:hypothetical protein